MNFARIGVRAAGTLHDEAVMRVSRFPMRYFDMNPIGRIFARFSSDYGTAMRTAGGPFADFVGHIFDFFWMFVLIGIASPYFLPLVILALGANAFIYFRSREFLRNERRALSAERGPSIAHFAETVQGHRVIKVFLRQQNFADRFGVLLQRLNLQKIRSTIAAGSYTLKMQAVTGFLLLGIAVLGLSLAERGVISLGSVAVAVTLVTMASQSANRFFELIVMIEEACTGLERLDEYIHAPLESGAALPSKRLFPTDQAVGDRDLRPLENFGEIELRDLRFRYDKGLPLILKGVSLKFGAGERVGIIGRTGSGKSSVLQAIYGLYPVETGNIFFNGMQVSTGGPGFMPGKLSDELVADAEISMDRFRRHLSLISQEPAIFQGSLRYNLHPGQLDDDLLLSTLESVGLGPWVKKLGRCPLDHYLAEKGGNLSAGQRQLICLARCILAVTPVLLMDEATSAVDPQAEAWIMRALDSSLKGRTQIIIAHRLSTIEKFDRLYWLDSGRVLMEGRPDEVIREYRRHADDRSGRQTVLSVSTV